MVLQRCCWMGQRPPAAPKTQSHNPNGCFNPTGWALCPGPTVAPMVLTHASLQSHRNPSRAVLESDRSHQHPVPRSCLHHSTGGLRRFPMGTLWIWRGRGDVLQPQELLPRSPAMHHAPMGQVVAVLYVGTRLYLPSARLTKRRVSTWGACSPWLCPLTQQSSPTQHGAAGRRLPGELSCDLQASRAWPWGLLLLLPGCSLSAACLGSINACLILLVTRLRRGLAFLLLYLQLP